MNRALGRRKTEGTSVTSRPINRCSYILRPLRMLQQIRIVQKWCARRWKTLDAETIMACGLVFITALLFWRCIDSCRHAFDFTDDAYYLINIKSYDLYPIPENATRFGVVYHPLYKLLHGDIFLLRAVDVVIKYILACVLAYLALAKVAKDIWGRGTSMVIAASVAALSFLQPVHYRAWMAPTPSYNSLNFEALLICMIGVILAAAGSTQRKKYLGAVLVGLGGALCFLARPSSAALLCCCVFLYFFPVSWERLKILCWMGCSALVAMLVCALLVDGSPFEMYHAYVTSYQDLMSLQGGQGLGLKRFLKLPSISMQEIMVFVLGATGLTLAAFCMKRKDTSALMALFACLLCTFLIMFPESAKSLFLSYHFPIVSIIAIAVPTLLVRIFWKQIDGYSFAPSESALVLMFFVLPAVYPFGSNLDYWMGATKVIIFPVVGTIMLCRLLPADMFKNVVPCFVMGMLLFATVSITFAQQRPQRQDAPISAQNTKVRIGGGTLKLSEGYAKYLDESRLKAREGGFISGTPVVDLTGQNPGTLFALEAEAVGSSWIVGGYRGSLDRATRVLQRVPQDKLKRSWLLVETGDGRGWSWKRAIPDEIFARLDLDFPSNYEKRAEWGLGKDKILQLYAPKVLHLEVEPKEPFAVSSIPPEHAEIKNIQCEGYIDVVGEVSHPFQTVDVSGKFHVLGWLAHSTQTGELNDQTFVTITDDKGNTSFVSTQKQTRSDVAAAFHREVLANAGYEAVIDASVFDGKAKLGLAALKDSILYKCKQLEVDLNFAQ